jgi:hypothetical protein
VNEPKSEDLPQGKSRTCKTEEHSKIVHSIKESGTYVTAKVFEMDTNLLIDTGATVSLLSKVCYGNMFGTSFSFSFFISVSHAAHWTYIHDT